MLNHLGRIKELCVSICLKLRDLKYCQWNAQQQHSLPKEDWVEGFILGTKTKVKQCVVLRQQRVLVLWLVALVMAFRNVQNLLLINHNNGFIDDDDEFVALYDLYASKNLNFPYNSYVPFDLEELDESKSFAEFCCGKWDIWILKEFCKSLTQLPAVSALFVMD